MLGKMNTEWLEDLIVTDRLYSLELLEVRGSNAKLVKYGGDSIS
jgi:hypothetical protein